jgi:2-polyprenyl-3-methyl-5-hydroxy-6-metoxy-1,4-benzoquinol methylase
MTGNGVPRERTLIAVGANTDERGDVMGHDLQAGTSQSEWLDLLEQAKNYNSWIFRMARPYLRGRVLEVGCGTGTFSASIASSVEHLTAVDIDADFVNRADQRLSGHPNVTVYRADATRELPDSVFDTVVMLDVIEHVADDAAMLGELVRRLSADGRIVLKVPAMPRLYNSLDRAVGHYRRYDRAMLERLAEAVGLSVELVESFNAAGIPGWWWNGLWSNSVAPESQIGKFDKVVPILEGLERVLHLPFGLSLIAVFQRSD